jgi:hypothetical protein
MKRNTFICCIPSHNCHLSITIQHAVFSITGQTAEHCNVCAVPGCLVSLACSPVPSLTVGITVWQPVTKFWFAAFNIQLWYSVVPKQAASPNTQTRNSSDWGSREEGDVHFVRRVKTRWKKLLTVSRGGRAVKLFLCLTSVEISQSVSKTNVLCLGSVK